jgi:hypothetical protein
VKRLSPAVIQPLTGKAVLMRVALSPQLVTCGEPGVWYPKTVDTICSRYRVSKRPDKFPAFLLYRSCQYRRASLKSVLAIPNPRPEDRRPKETRRPKSELIATPPEQQPIELGHSRNSDFRAAEHDLPSTGRTLEQPCQCRGYRPANFPSTLPALSSIV